MTVGVTQTGSLANSLPYVIESARIVRKFDAVMPRLVDRTTLPEGAGLDWNEISIAQMTAQTVTESTILDNPQQLADTLFSVTPTVAAIHTLITKRAERRIDRKVAGQIGKVAAQAMETKKDKDGLAILDGATTSLSGAGTTLTSGIIAAATSRIRGNTTEPNRTGSLYGVLHDYQLKDIEDEVLAGVGTYTIPSGLTQDAFRSGFSGTCRQAEMYTDGNIVIDSADDAKGGVFARDAIVLVEGFSPTTYTKELPERQGATAMWMYDEYAYGERSAGNWLYEVYSDALAPTS